MKQIIQDLKKGHTILEEVPVPRIKSGFVLIQTTRTLVSLGTERMLVDFGKANLLQKARQQPDKVKMVLEKVKSDGLRPTLEAVFNKLGQPLPLGYCNVGEVVAVGKGVIEFSVGDRVASNGNHAEFVCVAKNLVAKIPDNVSDEEAAFTVIGSIGLQGIRLLNPTFGETIVVVGLGLIGLVTAELLLANGCNVIGFDFDNEKIRIAKAKGITAINPAEGTDQVKFVETYTNGIGADGIIITASNKSNKIISQSAKMCRKRGRVILIGVVGLDINRADFYEKEITFQVSCSYGPGRYDDEYEQNGKDYPIGFVRWTEKRNFAAILNAIEKGVLDVLPLITDRFKLSEYQNIYNDMGNSRSIAEYKNQENVLIAIHKLRESGYNTKITFVGGGSGNSFDSFLEKQKDIDSNQNFSKLLPFIERDKLSNLFNESNLFLFASSCENMPITLLEGMTSHLPILCSNRGPMPAMLKEAGYFFDPEDVNSIVKSFIDFTKTIETNEFNNKILKANEYASEYTWEKTSKNIWRYVKEIYDER